MCNLIVGIRTESTSPLSIWWLIHQVALVYFDTKPSLVKPSQTFGRCTPPPPDTREHEIMPWGIRSPSIERRLVQVPRESYQQYTEGSIWLGIYHKETY